MKPIDADKLIDEINFHVDDYPTTWGHGFNKAMEYVKKWIESGKFNLTPGTLIIQRPPEYDMRDCSQCIFTGSDIENVCQPLEFGDACKYHITDEELKNAYIVGSNNK